MHNHPQLFLKHSSNTKYCQERIRVIFKWGVGPHIKLNHRFLKLQIDRVLLTNTITLWKISICIKINPSRNVHEGDVQLCSITAFTDREFEQSCEVTTQELLTSLPLSPRLPTFTSGGDAHAGSDRAELGSVPVTLLTSRPAIVIVESRPRL